MTKRNFGFEKRQKEMAKKQKQEAKRLRRLERAERPEDGAAPTETADEEQQPTE